MPLWSLPHKLIDRLSIFFSNWQSSFSFRFPISFSSNLEFLRFEEDKENEGKEEEGRKEEEEGKEEGREEEEDEEEERDEEEEEEGREGAGKEEEEEVGREGAGKEEEEEEDVSTGEWQEGIVEGSEEKLDEETKGKKHVFISIFEPDSWA